MKQECKIDAGWLSILVILLAIAWTTTGLLLAIVPREAPEPEPVKRLTRPQVCFPFYNDDSDRWVECMGVGYVKELRGKSSR